MAKKETPRKDAPAAKKSAPVSAPVREANVPAQSADEVASAAQANRQVDRDEVARRAYQRFLERGGQHGQDQDDWLNAEQELKGGGGRAGGHQ